MINFSLEKYKNSTGLTNHNGYSSLSTLKQNASLSTQSLDSRLDKLTVQAAQQLPTVFREKSVEILFLIDCSSSCVGTEVDTIDGYNNLVKREKTTGYPTKITTVLFNEEEQILENRTDVNDVKKLNYCADGGTAMYDALCSQIQNIKKQQSLDKNPPNKTIVAIMTDGQDMHSKRYGLYQTRDLIQERQNAGWEFIFLAANIDAKQVATNLGIKDQNSANYTTSNHGILLNFEAISKAISSLRENGSVDIHWAKDVEKNILSLEDKKNQSAYYLTRKQ